MSIVLIIYIAIGLAIGTYCLGQERTGGPFSFKELRTNIGVIKFYLIIGYFIIALSWLPLLTFGLGKAILARLRKGNSPT